MKSKIISSVHRWSGSGDKCRKAIKMMSRKLFYLIVLLPIIGMGQTTSENFIKSVTYRDSLAAVPVTNITYFDGLGRPTQQIAVVQSGNGKNMVTPFVYDSIGRQKKEYLPYVTTTTSQDFISGAVAAQAAYTPYVSQNGYSEKLFEASPLNRVLKQGAPGTNWALSATDHSIKFDYQTNDSLDVKLYRAVATWSGTDGMYNTAFSATGTAYYPKHQLYKTITKNENWVIADGDNNTTVEFKDKGGKVLLKRTYNDDEPHDTYYVYDQFGNLTYVLPPLSEGDVTDSNVMNGLCYQYKYDYRNRMVEKKLPGKQKEYIVYDKIDRVVATGPALNPFGGPETGWLITKYDAFNRPVYTAWMEEEEIDNSSRKIFQSAYGSAVQINETKSNATIEGVDTGYSNDVEPTDDLVLLTINYYDNYDYPDALTVPVSPIFGRTAASSVKGMPTGSWVRILEGPSGVVSELTHTFYDNRKFRPIWTYTTNYEGGHTGIATKYDFEGKVLKKAIENQKTLSDPKFDILEEFEYTTEGRLLNHFHTMEGGTREVLSHNEYNQLGQLVVKQVGGQDDLTFIGLQKVDYSYNIRGWLTKINDIRDLTLPSAPDDLFAFAINYDTASNDVPAVDPLYNGNISETYWRSISDNIQRKYGYVYDHLNRLTDAYYQKEESPIIVTNSYNEHLTYDKNGNIQTLNRNGNADDALLTLEIDNLEYTYVTSSNQLSAVYDSTADPMGFKDSITDGTDYNYDANGNMIVDVNKGIEEIVYNHLNLPVTIDFGVNGTITYLYDATGRKVKKRVEDLVNSTENKTHYLSGGFQYKNHILQFVHHSEGYVNVFYCEECESEYQYLFNYVYNYVDHLGNIRMSYAMDPDEEVLKILEENHYYPFGMKHTNYNVDVKSFQMEEEVFMLAPPIVPTFTQDYKYKYNGKEWQDEMALNMYDYGARNYDPAIGRWMNIDPLAEQYRSWSPYNYCVNNPMRFVDPDGMGVYNPGDKFASKQAAAIDFAKLYNGLSILNNVELKTTIYEVKNGNETYYSYTVPTGQITPDENGNNTSDGVAGTPNPAPKGTKFVSTNHTHAKYRQPSENEFSEGDKQGTRKRAENIPDYSDFVTTPGGQVLENNPYMPGETPPEGGKTIRVVSSDIPSDPNAPEGQRFNKINPIFIPGTIMPIINGEENYPLKTR